MSSLVNRIASRYLHSFQGNEADYEEESETKKKKGPPPHWDEFLKAKYSDGKKKVPNTNPKTKDRFHQVTMQTLFKSDEGFKKRVMKEYSDWMKTLSESDKKTPSTSDTEKKKKPSPKKPSRQAIPSEVLGTQEEVDAFLEKNTAAIDAAVKQYTEKLAYQRQRADDYGSDILPVHHYRSESEKKSFTQDVQLLARTSGDVGAIFAEEFNSTFGDIQDLFSYWRSSNANDSSRDMQDWVAGRNNTLGTAHKASLKRQYLFTQAFFKKAGITHVTVYRGIKGKGLDTDPPSEGDAVEVGARSLSCWSMNLNVAKGFGDRCCIAKVPVEQVFASPLTDPQFGHGSVYGECEFILMPAKGKDNIPVTIGGFNNR